MHSPFEAHYNGIGSAGAEVLLLPLRGSSQMPGSILADPDWVARLAERDPLEAVRYVIDNAKEIAPGIGDWTDMLAAELRCRLGLSISQWSQQIGLDAAVVSRGFRRHFGCTPSQYRLKAKLLGALRDIVEKDTALATIAYDHGFADQAHLSRAVRSLTGFSPTNLRAHRVRFLP